MSIKQKPTFTENLDLYRRFLGVANNGFEGTVRSLQDNIVLNNKIIAIIRKHENNEPITTQDFKDISIYGCPDHSFLTSCAQSIDEETGELVIPVSKHSVYDCSKTTCYKCWQKFINDAAKALNNSDFATYGIPEE